MRPFVSGFGKRSARSVKIAGTTRIVSVWTTSIFIAFFLFVTGWIWTTPREHLQGTVKIYDSRGTLLFELAGNTGRQETVGFERLPDHLVRAVIASEDESYYSHSGIDLHAVLRSLVLNIRSGKIVSGASTIPQQVARMNVRSRSGTTIARLIDKIRESIIAVRISMTRSKQDILSAYINEVYLGNHNYGFQSAAAFYFHKDVDALSLNESAYLVGMIASPSIYDPYEHPEEGEKRKVYVLARMGANGFITKEQMNAAIRTPCSFVHPSVDTIAPHYVDYILDGLASLGMPDHDVSVYTTLNVSAFRLSQTIASEWVKKQEEEHNVHNAAMVVLDNTTGAILSMLGGIDYYDSKSGGQVNVAVSRRQPGSSIKPVTYLAAFLKGYTPATRMYDVRKSYPTKNGEGFIPNNFGDTYHGLVLAREALASSYNMPAVEMLDRIGIDAFLDTAAALGITSFAGKTSYDYSITLGANEVTLLELTNAYATISRGGMYLAPYAIDRVVSGNGTVLYTHPESHPLGRLGAHGQQAAYLVTDILSDPIARMPGFGEKNYLALSRPAAVKTGTTSDWHDVWTIGYTPSYTVGVWMGNTDNTPMRNISSGTSAAAVWNQFMEEFLKDKPVEEFNRPGGITTREICALSGELYDSVCPERKEELFIEGTEPTTVSSLHRTVSVDIRNGLLAGPSCGAAYVEDRLLIDYPPEVYSWAVANRKPYVPHDRSPLCDGVDVQQSNVPLYISITSPKNKAVYQNAPQLIRNQGIFLEANVSGGISSVLWYVDDVLVAEVNAAPFSAVLPLQTGNHIVYAVGRGNDTTAKSERISFRVVDLH